MRGLATKTERQPFAPFQRIFQLQPSDRDETPSRPARIRIQDWRFNDLFRQPIDFVETIAAAFRQKQRGVSCRFGHGMA
jgi:hypothetical protein